MNSAMDQPKKNAIKENAATTATQTELKYIEIYRDKGFCHLISIYIYIYIYLCMYI